MSAIYEENIDIYLKTKEMTGMIGELDRAIDEKNIERYTGIPMQLESLRAQLKNISECEEEIKKLKKLAERSLTSMNVLTIDAPAGYKVNLARLRKWADMIDPRVYDDPYAKRLYLVCVCDLYFLQKKRAEFNDRIRQLEQNRIFEKNEDIQDLVEQRSEKIEELGDYVSSVTNEVEIEAVPVAEVEAVPEAVPTAEVESVAEVEAVPEVEPATEVEDSSFEYSPESVFESVYEAVFDAANVSESASEEAAKTPAGDDTGAEADDEDGDEGTLDVSADAGEEAADELA